MLGTAPGGIDYLAAPTDVAQKGEVQRWKIYNLTGDTHPMHFHLVNVTIRKREVWAFDSSGDPILPLQPIPGTERPPDPNEQGWKETVRMNPGEVVTVDMKFDLPHGNPPPPVRGSRTVTALREPSTFGIVTSWSTRNTT